MPLPASAGLHRLRTSSFFSHEGIGQGAVRHKGNHSFHPSRLITINEKRFTIHCTVAQVQIPAGPFLYGVCMSSLCMGGFSPSTPASFHSQKTCFIDSLIALHSYTVPRSDSVRVCGPANRLVTPSGVPCLCPTVAG